MSSKRFDLVKDFFANILIKEAEDGIPTFLNVKTLLKELAQVKGKLSSAQEMLIEKKQQHDAKQVMTLASFIKDLELKKHQLESAIALKAEQTKTEHSELPPLPNKREDSKQKILDEYKRMEDLRNSYQSSRPTPEKAVNIFPEPPKESIKVKPKQTTKPISVPETEIFIPEEKVIPEGEEFSVPKISNKKKIKNFSKQEVILFNRIMQNYIENKIDREQTIKLLKDLDLSAMEIFNKLQNVDFETEIKKTKQEFQDGVIPAGLAKTRIIELAKEKNLSDGEIKNILKTFTEKGSEYYEGIPEEPLLFDKPQTGMPFAPLEKKDDKTTVYSPGESKFIECKSCGLLNDPWDIITEDDEKKFVNVENCKRCKEKLDGDIRPAHEFTQEKVKIKPTKDLQTRKEQKIDPELLKKTKSTFEDSESRFARNYLKYNINVKKNPDGTPIKDKNGLPIPLQNPIGILTKDLLKMFAWENNPKELQKVIEDYNKQQEEEGNPTIVPIRRAVNMDDPKDIYEMPSLHAWNINKLSKIPALKERNLYVQNILIPRTNLIKAAEKLKEFDSKENEIVKTITHIKSQYQPYEAYQKLAELRAKNLTPMSKEELYQLTQLKNKKDLSEKENTLKTELENKDKDITMKIKLENKIGKNFNKLKSTLETISPELSTIRSKSKKAKEKFISITKHLDLGDLLQKEYDTEEKIPTEIIDAIQEKVNQDYPEVKDMAELPEKEIEKNPEIEEIEKIFGTQESQSEKTASRLERIISLALTYLK